ncbi:MAG: GntR family transcriptional regulator [Chloroflexi bacterium]|nr:GntR family transcriptional regulator [Chloroflexota bacterium]
MGHAAPLPLYYKIEQQLRRAIASGVFQPGSRLPNEEDLARSFGVSRATIRTALKRLEEDDLIVRRRAHGTMVRLRPLETHQVERHLGDLLSFEEDILRAGLVPQVEVLSSEQSLPAGWAREALTSPPGELLLHVRRIGRVEGEPLWVESRYFAPHVGRQLEGVPLDSASLTRVVQRVCGVRVTSSRVAVHAETASEYLARLLRRPTGSAVLVCQFTFIDHEQVPLEVARSIYPADRYFVSVQLTSPATTAWPVLSDRSDGEPQGLVHRVG